MLTHTERIRLFLPELTKYRQWVLAGAGPINPMTLTPASSTDATTWGSFEDACDAANTTGLALGFVLTAEDPFVCLDLDDKIKEPATDAQLALQDEIINEFDGYCERSRSGRGFHIFCKGVLPGGLKGFRTPAKVDVFAAEHYIALTGDVIRDDLNLYNHQITINEFFAQIPQAQQHAARPDKKELLTDREVWDMAASAENGDLFTDLWNGQWEIPTVRGAERQRYSSQSEADFALLDILCYFTPNNEQVTRLFLQSGLGLRNKARRRGYLGRMVSRIRAEEPPPISLVLGQPEPVAASFEESAPAISPPGQEGVIAPAPAVEVNLADRALSWPPGLVGQTARYIYETSIRPVKSVSIAATVSLYAGMLGRCYNFSGTGLNLYTVIIGGTGVGKEGAGEGIKRILGQLEDICPGAYEFLGPSTIASGSGLRRELDVRPCFLSITNEVGYWFETLTAKQANEANVSLKRLLLSLYTHSGKHGRVEGTAYSDSNKNSGVVRSPAVSILGETTAEALNRSLNASNTADGFIPRWLFFNCGDYRPPLNDGAYKELPDDLLSRLALLVQHVQAQNLQSLTHVMRYTPNSQDMTPEAQVILRMFDETCDRAINGTGEGIMRQMYTRAHLKALRLSALLAIADNHLAPVIAPEHARWAVDTVMLDVAAAIDLTTKGNMISDISNAKHELIEYYLHYEFKGDPSLTGKGFCGYLVTGRYLRRRFDRYRVFSNGRQDAGKEIQQVLSDLVREGVLDRLTYAQTRELGTRAKDLYVINQRRP